MKKSFPIAVKLLIGLLILIVTGQGLAWGFVLCIGEDGHSAIEQAVAGKCAPEEPTCSGESEGANHDHCGPCRDIATALDFVHGRWYGDDDLSQQIAMPQVAAIASPVYSRKLPAKFSSLPPPRPYQSLFALRTVVLLN